MEIEALVDSPVDNSTIFSNLESVNQQLAHFGKERLNPEIAPDSEEAIFQKIAEHAELANLEINFLLAERQKIAAIAAEAPTDVDGFIEWYENLKEVGPGQYDPLFTWLAEEATMDEMRWFIRQEVVGEAGFDDLISLTQLRMPTRPKLEMSRNLWDEMGVGKEKGMHGPMLEILAEEMNISEIGETVWEAQSLSNVMVGLAANRCFAFHSVGCLGAVELTAPSRCVEVVKGLERLGISNQAAIYYRLHSLIDVRHSEDWNKEVIANLVAEDPARARCIAEGALMRLNAGARTFDRYRDHFGLGGERAHVTG